MAAGQFLKKLLRPLAILSKEKTMVAKVISELKFVPRVLRFIQKRLSVNTAKQSLGTYELTDQLTVQI